MANEITVPWNTLWPAQTKDTRIGCVFKQQKDDTIDVSIKNLTQKIRANIIRYIPFVHEVFRNFTRRNLIQRHSGGSQSPQTKTSTGRLCSQFPRPSNLVHLKLFFVLRLCWHHPETISLTASFRNATLL